MSLQDPPRAQVAVLGGGPSAAILSAALLKRGVDVCICAPQWPARWPNTYGLWLDELPPALHGAIAARWDRPAVRFGQGAAWRQLDRPYVRLDNARLQALIYEGHEPRVCLGLAQQVEHSLSGAQVTLRAAQGDSGVDSGVDSGGELGRAVVRATLVVDATGYDSPRVALQRGGSPSHQTAFGLKLSAQQAKSLDAWQLPPGGMALMDYGLNHGLEDGHQASAPSFLYAMELPHGEVFVEETSLSARPMLTRQALMERLARRLGVRIEPEEALETEWCVIPMGGALPRLDQRTLAYGGAAGLVHPASGYQLARALARVEPMAEVIAQGLRRADRPQLIARRAWEQLWDEEHLRQRALYLFGLETLLGFDHEALCGFMSTFFDQPAHGAYLSGTLSSGQLATMMLGLFADSSMGQRARLARPALGAQATHLVEAAWPGLWRALGQAAARPR